MTPPLTGLGRDVLLRMIADLVKERDDLAANLTATQARCTELLEECRALRRARVDGLLAAATPEPVDIRTLEVGSTWVILPGVCPPGCTCGAGGDPPSGAV